MKIYRIILFAVLLTLSLTAKSQNKLPETFNYQAVINDDEGKPVAEKDITVEITIFQGETEKYKELHNTVTSELGLFSVEIGSGTQIAGENYSEINWLDISGGFYYLQVKADFGKSEFLNGMNDLGKTKFSAVPYALAAKNAQSAEKVTNMVLSDLTDVEVAEASDGQVLTLDGGKWVAKTITSAGPSADKLSLLTDVALTSAEAGQVLSFDGSKWVNKTVEAKTALSELTDVTISKNLAGGHILKYDGESKKWINAPEGDMWKIWEKGIYTTQRVEIGKSTSTTPFTDDSKFLLEISQSDGHGILFKENEMYMKGGSIVVGSTSKVEKIINSTPNVPVGCLAFYGDIDSDHNFAFGINGDKSVVSGSKGSIAFGTKCNVLSSNNAAGFGNNIKIQNADCQFVCGKFNNVAKNDGSNPYPLFVVGNGTGESDRRNAFYVTTAGTAFANSVELSSDSRLKNNVTTIGSALDKIVKLRGVTFNWDLSKRPSADKKLQYGFIAQEVEKIFPELVTTDSEGFKSLNYIGIVPVLTEAVKELKAENDELKSTIQDLVKRIEALEKK